MRTIATAALAAVLCAALGAGLAAAPAAAYTVKNGVECPDVLAEDASPEFRELNIWWLMGYITARNYENGASVGASQDNNSIYRIALEFCEANPASDWDDAAIYVYEQLF